MGTEPDSGISRREMLTRVGNGLVGFTIVSAFGRITPAEARVQGVPLGNLSALEGQLLEALGDTLLPGAAQAGVAQYVDNQLGQPVPLLFLKYMDYAGSFVDFYKQGLGSIEQFSRTRYDRSFLELTSEQKKTLVGEMSRKNPAGWTGAPAPLFYFVVRNDAVDVYYGSPAGFTKLGVPYMPLLEPPDKG